MIATQALGLQQFARLEFVRRIPGGNCMFQDVVILGARERRHGNADSHFGHF